MNPNSYSLGVGVPQLRTVAPSGTVNYTTNIEPEVIRNLIVNFLPAKTNEYELDAIFTRFGPTESVRIFKDYNTGISRGFGFVKYRSSVSAIKAIESFNGFPIHGKRLKVRFAKEREAFFVLDQMGVQRPKIPSNPSLYPNITVNPTRFPQQQFNTQQWQPQMLNPGIVQNYNTMRRGK